MKICVFYFLVFLQFHCFELNKVMNIFNAYDSNQNKKI